MLNSTIAVVTTTMVIFALKAFDIVYVMTNGNFNTDVMATAHVRRAVQRARLSAGPALSR